MLDLLLIWWTVEHLLVDILPPWWTLSLPPVVPLSLGTPSQANITTGGRTGRWCLPFPPSWAG